MTQVGAISDMRMVGRNSMKSKKIPYEWNNLAEDKKYLNHLNRLRKKAPVKFAKLVEPKIDSLPALRWIPLAKG